MQSRRDIRRDDSAKPQLHANLAGTDDKESAAEPQQESDDCGARSETARGKEQAGRAGDLVPEPDPTRPERACATRASQIVIENGTKRENNASGRGESVDFDHDPFAIRTTSILPEWLSGDRRTA